MKPTVYAVCGMKGGTGKTATVEAMAAGAKLGGLRSLVIDLDSQRSVSQHFGADCSGSGTRQLLEGTAPAALIQATDCGDIIPASRDLMNTKAAPDSLRAALKQLRRAYDVIILDTPPAMSTMLYAALATADKAVIVCAPAVSSIEGLADLIPYIRTIQKKDNKALTVAGLLITMHTTRSTSERERIEYIRESCPPLGVPVFDTVIRRSVVVEQAENERQSIYEYAPRSPVAVDYAHFIAELLKE